MLFLFLHLLGRVNSSWVRLWFVITYFIGFSFLYSLCTFISYTSNSYVIYILYNHCSYIYVYKFVCLYLNLSSRSRKGESCNDFDDNKY